MQKKAVVFSCLVVVIALALVTFWLATTRDSIHAAAARGDVSAIEAFLRKDPARLCRPDRHGLAPLHYAAWWGQCAAVEYLMDQGTPPDIRANKQTPLHFAARRAQNEVIGMLIARGATVDARGFIGETPLMFAAARGHTSTVQLLLKSGASVSAADSQGVTALHDAAEHGRPEVLKILVERGAPLNVSAPGRGDATPLHLAVMGRQLETSRMLIAYGTDIDARMFEDRTPLHLAAEGGLVEIVHMLLENDADKEAVTDFGATALELARVEGHEDVVTALSGDDW